MLAIVIAKYINNAALEKQRARRKEELVTVALGRGVQRNRANLRSLRKQADTLIIPNDNLLRRFLPTFLAGKKSGFTVKQLKQMVIDARAKGTEPEGPHA